MKQVKNFVKSHVDGQIIVKAMKTVDSVNGVIGSLLVPLMPARVNTIKKHQFTLTVDKRRSLIDTFLRAGIARSALANPDYQEIFNYHRAFWEGETASEWHEKYRWAFDDWYTHFSFHFDLVRELLDQHPEIKNLCEIGTGAGQVLEKCAHQFSTIENLYGIDLSPETIEKNIASYSNPRLHFIAADANEWIFANAKPNWIFMSFGGVLEYFPQPMLEKLLEYIATELRPAIFTIIEPVGVDHNFETHLNSQTYGREFSFSHNYPHLFAQAGFEVRNLVFKPFYSYRYCLVVATKGI